MSSSHLSLQPAEGQEVPGGSPVDEAFVRLRVAAGGHAHAVAVAEPETPPAATVLAVHGFGTSGERTFRHVAPFLCGAGLRLVAPDLSGFGASEAPGRPPSLAFYADHLRELADALDLDRPLLLGHSMGGAIAASAAALYPDRFRGVVLVNPSGFGIAGWLANRLATSRLVHFLLGRDWIYHHLLPRTPFGPLFRSEAARAQLRLLTTSRHALDIEHGGLRTRMEATRLPVLVVWGARDPLLPPGSLRAVLRVFPHADVALLRAAGHAPMVDDPAAFARIVDAFARRHAGRDHPAGDDGADQAKRRSEAAMESA